MVVKGLLSETSSRAEEWKTEMFRREICFAQAKRLQYIILFSFFTGKKPIGVSFIFFARGDVQMIFGGKFEGNPF